MKNGYSITLIPKSWAFGRWDIRSKTLWALGPFRFGFHRNLRGTYGGPKAAPVTSPHCDEYVLHAPGECVVCDHYPEEQEIRKASRVNFTGHQDPGKAICPSQHRRDLANIEAWQGNRPQGPAF